MEITDPSVVKEQLGAFLELKEVEDVGQIRLSLLYMCEGLVDRELETCDNLQTVERRRSESSADGTTDVQYAPWLASTIVELLADSRCGLERGVGRNATSHAPVIRGLLEPRVQVLDDTWQALFAPNCMQLHLFLILVLLLEILKLQILGLGRPEIFENSGDNSEHVF